MKNIVICCDGTGNEYGDKKSNVIRLYQCLDNSGGRQVSYYHPGVGTMGDMRALSAAGKAWTTFRGLAFGYGLSENIADAYRYLMQSFEDGDRIYIFGFSRGAYAARALCGLLQMGGLLCPGNEGYIPYALRLFKRRDGFLTRLKGSPNKFRIAAGFKKTFGRECRPHFLGLWDTVSSVGWILDPIGLRPGSLPYTYELGDVSVIRHAVSLDERRAFFRSNLVRPADRDMKQVWFAGVHSDVGGSYAEAESGLATISLKWMLREASHAGLMLNPAKMQATLEGVSRARPLADAPMHNSLTVQWWLGEFWPKFTRRKVSPPGVVPERYRGRPRLNLFRRRFVPENSTIHESVIKRTRILSSSYAPSNLPLQRIIESDFETVGSQIQLSPGESALFGIFASLKWNNTTLEVHSGETYELSARGTWYDAHIASGPEGYISKSLLQSIFNPLRRRPRDPWFALIGAVGQREKSAFVIGERFLWKVDGAGTLHCYANDVPGFYFNNHGYVGLKVERIT